MRRCRTREISESCALTTNRKRGDGQSAPRCARFRQDRCSGYSAGPEVQGARARGSGCSSAIYCREPILGSWLVVALLDRYSYQQYRQVESTNLLPLDRFGVSECRGRLRCWADARCGRSYAAHDEPVVDMVPVQVGPVGGAGAGCGARHRADRGAPAGAQGSEPRHLYRGVPAAVPFNGHEPLPAAAAPIGACVDSGMVARCPTMTPMRTRDGWWLMVA